MQVEGGGASGRSSTAAIPPTSSGGPGWPSSCSSRCDTAWRVATQSVADHCCPTTWSSTPAAAACWRSGRTRCRSDRRPSRRPSTSRPRSPCKPFRVTALTKQLSGPPARPPAPEFLRNYRPEEDADHIWRWTSAGGPAPLFVAGKSCHSWSGSSKCNQQIRNAPQNDVDQE